MEHREVMDAEGDAAAYSSEGVVDPLWAGEPSIVVFEDYDVRKNFYKIQILRNTLRNDEWIVWTRWGNTQRESKATEYRTSEEACSSFASLFKSKTSNDRAKRKYFLKKEGKYASKRRRRVTQL